MAKKTKQEKNYQRQIRRYYNHDMRTLSIATNMSIENKAFEINLWLKVGVKKQTAMEQYELYRHSVLTAAMSVMTDGTLDKKLVSRKGDITQNTTSTSSA